MRLSPGAAARRLRQMAQDLQRELRQAEKENLTDGLRLALNYSSGLYSEAMLRRLGHPYAQRAPNPPNNPANINLQTGQFIASWRRQLGNWQGGNLHSEIRNNAAYALFLEEGTARMIARPIKEAIVAELGPRRRMRLLKAVRKALTP